MTANSPSDVAIQPVQSTNLNPTLAQLPSSISQLQGSTVSPSLQEQQLQLLSPTAQQALTGAQAAATYGMPIGSNLYTTGMGIAGTGQEMVQQGQGVFDQGQGVFQQGRQVFGEANSILPYAQQVFQTGLDPQQQLYNWLQNQNTQQSEANASAAGVGTTPYGVAETDQANMLFNINWQNQQLQRQIAALQSGAGAIGTAAGIQQTGTGIETAGTGIETAGTGIEQAGTNVQTAGLGLAEQAPAFISGTSAIPYATRSGITSADLSTIGQAGANQNITIQDLLAFLSGQNQVNQVGNQTSQVGLQQSQIEAQQLAALVSGASGLAGGLLGGATGTGVSGLSSLGSGLGRTLPLVF